MKMPFSWKVQHLLLLGLMLPWVPYIPAASTEYTSWYQPDMLPTETEGTIENPLWKFQTQEGAISYVNDGMLSGNTMECPESAGCLQFWQIGVDGDLENGRPFEAWAQHSQSAVTVDFSIKVKQSRSNDRTNSGVPGGFEILVAFGGHAINLYFDTNGITAWGSKIISDDLSPNTSLSTYRLVVEEGLATLFEAGNNTPLLAEMEMRKGRETYNMINFGTGTTTLAGDWNLAFLGWNSGVAEFSPPPKFPLAKKTQ